jgi:flagellar protein FlaF
MQNLAAESYARTGKVTASPRALEASLLSKAAGRLQAVRDDWEGRRGELDAALTFNRKLWTVFVSSVIREDNPLPRDLKQNVANLGIFVFNHTLGIQVDPAPHKLGALISINRQLAEGLRATPSPAP